MSASGSFSLKHSFTHSPCSPQPGAARGPWWTSGVLTSVTPPHCEGPVSSPWLLFHTWAIPWCPLNLSISKDAACHACWKSHYDPGNICLACPFFSICFKTTLSGTYATIIFLVSFFYFTFLLKIIMMVTHLKSHSIFQLVRVRKERGWKPS